MSREMRLPEEVIDLLRCPSCRAQLEFADGQFVCASGECEARYPVVDGVPIIINEHRSLFALADFLNRSPTFFAERSKFVETFNRLLPTIGANIRARHNYGDWPLC